MTTWSEPRTVKSNARREAKKLGVDPAKVVAIVKAGKTLYRFPMPEAKATKAKAQKSAKKVTAPKAAKPAAPAAKAEQSAAPKAARGPAGDKFTAVAALLRRQGGASMDEVTKATGWKPHSARARISVDVSKLLAKNETIVRRREEGQSWYSIVKDGEQMDLPMSNAA